MACKLILGTEYDEFKSTNAKLNLLSFKQIVFVSKVTIMYEVADGVVPQYICDLFI